MNQSSLHAPPVRFYRSLREPTGQPYLVIEYSNIRQSKLDALMKEGAIVEKEVTSWSAKFRFGLSRSEVGALVWALNLIRVTVHLRDAPTHSLVAEAKELELLHRRTEKSIRQLSADLPKLIDFRCRYGADGRVLQAFLVATFQAEGLLKKSWSGWADAYRRSGHKSWHDDALYLAAFLTRAANSAGKPLSLTKETAPAVEFIHAALQRAKVQHGSCGAIARALARYKSNHYPGV
jgi:hypothetical protein